MPQPVAVLTLRPSLRVPVYLLPVEEGFGGQHHTGIVIVECYLVCAPEIRLHSLVLALSYPHTGSFTQLIEEVYILLRHG